MKRWILCLIVFIVGTISSVRHTTHECASSPHVTIAAHPYCTASAYRCVHNAMSYILPRTYNAHTIRDYLQYIMPHLRDIQIRWITPRHAHLQLALYKPCVRVTNGNAQYVITENGACVSSRYIQQDTITELPHIIWKSNDDIREHGADIIQLYTNIPRTWWNTYTAHWHAATDIRLYPADKTQIHIRTTLYRIVSDIDKISRVIAHEAHTAHGAWVDIRFARYAFAYKTIRGR